MHDIRFIREQSEAFDQGLKRRGLAPMARSILEIDTERRATQTQMQELQAKRNDMSKEIGDKKRLGNDATALMHDVGVIKNNIANLEKLDGELATKLNGILSAIPNIPGSDVP